MKEKLLVGIVVMMIVGFLALQSAYAGPPRWQGQGYGGHAVESWRQAACGEALHIHGKQGGRIPPGLAKQNKVPPGHFKKWKVGQPLAGKVVFHEPPAQIVTRLGPPPQRHRYVRVAHDILLIAIGTGMVVDAIENLAWEFDR